ncbi:MAG: hypothetical protein ONB44_03205 [candidate division KSB1 bacterium]|nr:hypothetical protein [candidate division KSB1 bacterium]MDZ7301135.1 hypothetical protein [candidate division KSB1 bacterium]MDZ7311981.1 hypothetical protein [candidate division KSB1 bacterium]
MTAAINPPARVKGIVLCNRSMPALESHAVTRDRTICGQSVPDETLLIHKKGGIRNVLVFIANITPETLPALDLELETKACRFHPHVLALGVGSQLVIRNSDPILHSVHARLREFIPGWDKTSTLDIFNDTEETYFHFAFPQKNAVAVQKLEKPGLLRLRSDSGHDWMSGYVLVMPHRYFTVTNTEGKFELPELPPGQYDLVMWHEKLGVKRQIIEVKTGDKNELLIQWFPDETIIEADSAKTNE